MTEDHHPPADPDELAQRFVDHFEPILCETDEDRELLARLAERVREYEHDGEDLRVELENPWEGLDTLVCEAPYEGDVEPSVPASFATLAGHHNGIHWTPSGGGSPAGFGGVADGELAAIGFWDYTYLEDYNPEYVEALGEAGLAPTDPGEAFGCGQNFLLFDPLEERENGEPGLAFVDHGLLQLEPIHDVETLGAGQVLLRLMADYFLDTGELPGVYV